MDESGRWFLTLPRSTASQRHCKPAEHYRWDPDARAEDLLQMSGVAIRHGGSRAFYRPSDDEIHLPPPRAFPDAGRYYATALHELTHWSSRPSRCNRQLGQRFGDDAYAAEEL